MTGIILAGGESRRIGIDKALLPMGGSTIIERLIDVLSEVTEEVLIVSNSPEKFKHIQLPLFRDILPNSGSLGGIYTGLSVSKTHHNLFLACDLPFVKREFLRYLISLADDFDVVIPKSEDGYEPLCAIYSKNCLGPIKRQLEANDLKIIHLFHKVRVKVVESETIRKYNRDGKMLFNINTKEDYQEALSFLALEVIGGEEL